jgi:poly(A) polymerase
MTLLHSLRPELREAAFEVLDRLRSSGHRCLIAGGAVRDLLLGREVKEIDIATSAPPSVVERLFPQTVGVGRQFGVILVIHRGIRFEVATFRTESGHSDGRRPDSVSFTDAQEDARRRDFTVNALFLDPESGQVLDFVGGRKDLEDGVIRTVGDACRRFEEDRLRLLRAVRFACLLGFELDPATFQEIRRQAPAIRIVSAERIRDELMKILTGPAPHRGLDLLRETGLLREILPEVEAMVGVAQPPQFHPEGDVFVHTRLMLELARHPLPETLALGILLHDVGKPPTFREAERIRFDGHAEVGAEMADTICRRLRLPNETVGRVVALVRDHLRFMHVQEMRESTLKRFLRQPHIEEHLELHRLDCLSSHRDLANWEFCKQKLEELGREKIRPAPLLNGHDLIRQGLKPGPLFKAILGELEDLQLEGRITSRQQALEWLAGRAAPPVTDGRTRDG